MSYSTNILDEVLDDVDGLSILQTRPCLICHHYGTVLVDPEALEAIAAGTLIQDALPMTAPAIREQIISGTHPDCWEAAFGTLVED